MIHATIGVLHLPRQSPDTILFLERKPGEGDIHHGLFVPPGGKVERGERPVDCIVREFLEETGLQIHNPKLRALVTFYNQDRVLGGKVDPEDWFCEVYESRKYSGELKPETTRVRPVWMQHNEWQAANMHEGDRELLRLLSAEGVYEVLVKYQGTRLEKFDYKRVA